MEGEDLAPAIGEGAVAGREAVDEQYAHGWAIAFADQVLIGGDVAQLEGHKVKNTLFSRAQLGPKT